jgi:hypothetical protein
MEVTKAQFASGEADRQDALGQGTSQTTQPAAEEGGMKLATEIFFVLFAAAVATMILIFLCR